MPDPGRLLTILRAATQAFRDTPGRRGRLVCLTDVSEVFATGDVDWNVLFREGVNNAYAPRGDEIYAAYLELLAAVPLALRTPNRVFLSHSLPSAKHLPNFDRAVIERDTAEEIDLEYGGS